MSQRLKYKIISYSSEEKQYPVTSLLVPGSDGWQTKRFCNYPQQVTLEFYGVARVDKIQILADNRKIASSADILYYDPTQSATESRFTKYGSLQFTRNESNKIHEQKTVMVDMKCLYLRFLFHRPFKNKENFFSQVQIHQIAIFGGESNLMLPLETGIKRSGTSLDLKSINQEDDQFIYEKLMQLNKRKQHSVMEQDYDQAERIKQIMINVKKFGYKLKAVKDKKNEAAEKQNYEEAKSLKQQIDRMKKQVDMLVSEAIDGDINQQQNDVAPEMDHDVQGNQFVGLEINKLLEREDQSRISQKNSRVKQNNSFVKKTQRNHYQSSYDERIIPTLQNKLKTEQSQVVPEERQKIQPPQEINGNNAADASFMMEFFSEETVKQFFSKHWQHKEKALTDIPTQAAQKPQDAQLIKCLIRIVAHSISETNFKISQLSISLLRQVLKINQKSHKLTKNNVQGRDLNRILEEVIKKNSDNNAKTRNSSEQAFQQMLDSSLFGVQYCCSALMKPIQGSKGGLVKQQVQKLSSLIIITSKYGLGSNGVPLSIVDFGVQKLSNPSGEVRNQAIHLLAVCRNKDQKIVNSQLEGKKSTYMQQIEAKQKQLTSNPKPSKK